MPPNALTVDGGTVVVFSAIFASLVTGQPADPAGVAFSFGVAGGTDPTVYIYGTDGELVKDAVGAYHVNVDTTGIAPSGTNVELVGQFDGNAEDTETIQVTGSAQVLVSAPPFPSPFDS